MMIQSCYASHEFELVNYHTDVALEVAFVFYKSREISW